MLLSLLKNRKYNRLSHLLLLLFFLTFTSQVKANDPALDWKTISSQHFTIHFDQAHQEIAFETATLAESIHQKLAKRLNWSPKQKTSLILTDSTDFANGNATPFPNNRSNLIIKPPTGTGFDYTSWLELLLTHEYTHILHLDKATGAPGFIRHIFGRFYLLFPNVFQPNWFIEGLATYIETDKENHIGRGQSSMFEMMMRVEVNAGIKPISQVNLYNTDWPINQSYLYGEHFYRFVSEQYGEDKVIKLSDEYGNDLLPLFVNRNANKVFGKDLTQLWSEFSDYLKQRYLPQVDKIINQTIIEGHKVTNEGFFTQVVEPTENGFYYLRRNDSETSMLMFQSNLGQSQAIVEINSSANLDWNPNSGLIVAQPEVCGDFNIYYDLYLLKPESNDLERLTYCSRYSHARWSAKGDFIVGLRTQMGIFQLDKLNLTGQLLETLWLGNKDEVISEFDLSKDNEKLIVSIRDKNAPRWLLKELQISNNHWTVLTESRVNSVFPRYSADGKSIFFSADINGVYNLYKMALGSQQAFQLTNLLGGAFQVVESFDRQNLFYAGYHQQGYDIFKLPLNDQEQQKIPLKTHTLIETENSAKIKVLEQSQINDVVLPLISPQQKNLEISMQDYTPWKSLKPAYWFPFAQGNENDVDIGALTSGSDDLGIHQYSAAIASNTTKQTIYGAVGYAYSRYFNMRYERQYEYGTEIDEVTAYRLENNLDFSFHLPLTKIQSQWDFRAGISTNNIERGIYMDDTFINLARFHDDVIGFGFSFNNSNRFFKSISQNSGRQVAFNAETSDILSSDFSGEIYSLDWREYFQLAEQHTLAVRFVQGWGTESPNLFRLGGEVSDSFFISENNLNQRSYALRGYDKGLPELIGRRMQLASVEYRFPISRIERTWMAPAIGIGTISGKIFYDRGTAYENSPINYYSGTGFELDSQIILFYVIPLDITLGYSKGLDLMEEKQFYFRLGTSF